MKLSDIETIWRKTPTKVTAKLNGEKVNVKDLTTGFAPPLGYGVTFNSATNPTLRTVTIAATNEPVIALYLNGVKLMAPRVGKLFDLDTHLLSVTTELRWLDASGKDYLLSVSVSKNPFAGLFG